MAVIAEFRSGCGPIVIAYLKHGHRQSCDIWKNSKIAAPYGHFGENVNSLKRHFIAIFGTFVLAGCSVAPPKTADFVEQPNTCAVLVGGGGMVFSDEALNQRWFKINSILSNDIADDLQQKGYHIERMIVDIRNNDERRAALGAEMTKTQCNKFIQVTHALEDIAQGGGTKRYFTFGISVMGAKRKERGDGATQAVIVGGFHKNYRYPLTSEV